MNIVMYTANIGGKDSGPVYPFPLKEGEELVYISNSPFDTPSGWEHRYPEVEFDNPRKTARFCKTCPEEYFPHADITIWVDASQHIKAPISEIVEHCSGYSFGSFKHPTRDCIYDEAKTVIDFKLDNRVTVAKQVSQFSKAGYPKNNGLLETQLVYRDHRDKRIRDVNRLWWGFIRDKSIRDQLSINFILWLIGMEYKEIPRNVALKRPHIKPTNGRVDREIDKHKGTYGGLNGFI